MEWIVSGFIIGISMGVHVARSIGVLYFCAVFGGFFCFGCHYAFIADFDGCFLRRLHNSNHNGWMAWLYGILLKV